MRPKQEFTEAQYREVEESLKAAETKVEDRLMEALAFMDQTPGNVKSFSGFDWIVTSL